jgi:hypothetical protein
MGHPIAPFSLKDIDLPLGRFLALSGSLSFNSIGALAIKDNNGQILGQVPMVGPLYSILGSLAGKIKIPIKIVEVSAQGGVFGFFNVPPNLLAGNLDRLIADKLGHTQVTSDFSIDGKWGWGCLFGGDVTVWVAPTIGISVGASYYIGGADLNVSGGYIHDSVPEANPPSFLQGAALDYSGLEISVGGTYKL